MALQGEPRWHSASAVVVVIGLTLLMPDQLLPVPGWAKFRVQAQSRSSPRPT